MKKWLVVSLLLVIPVATADDSVPVAPTDSGSSVKALLYARPFELSQRHLYHWTREKPKISKGFILVVEVDPEYARPRQVNVPVLYVGDKPAELTNVGYQSGRMIVIVPGEPDLKVTPIFFGSMELPERVDAARGRAEQAAAEKLGIRPFPPEAVQAALIRGGGTLRVRDTVHLYLAISDLILIFSPTEIERAESYRILPREN